MSPAMQYRITHLKGTLFSCLPANKKHSRYKNYLDAVGNIVRLFSLCGFHFTNDSYRQNIATWWKWITLRVIKVGRPSPIVPLPLERNGIHAFLDCAGRFLVLWSKTKIPQRVGLAITRDFLEWKQATWPRSRHKPIVLWTWNDVVDVLFDTNRVINGDAL